jgi:hypothetical protein
MALPRPKYARVDPQNPEAWAVCDHCGFYRNRSDLVWQYEWGGMHLYNKEILVCRERCYDTPQEQLRTIILPPDPPPIVNARVPNFALEEFTVMQAERQSAQQILLLQGGFNALTLQILTTTPVQPS